LESLINMTVAYIIDLDKNMKWNLFQMMHI
jgi:hypothetical protein